MLFRHSACRALSAAALLALAATALPAQAAPKKESKNSDRTVTVAHIKLAGSLDEGVPPSDPLLGGLTENFKAKLDRIRKARDDKKVRALYLQIEGLRLGWGKLDELSRAIADFRKSGKKVFAYVESGESRDYLLALACDEICVPESGWLLLTGVRAEVAFFKDLLGNIGVKADMLQMGEAKSAAEPFTRNSLSEPARKQLELVLEDRYEHGMVERIAQARKLTPEQVKKLIDQGPYTARAALKAGLIDRVGYVDEYRGTLKKALKAEKISLLRDYEKKKAEDVDLSNPFAILRLLATPRTSSSKKPKVAVIYAVGPIVTGKSTDTLLGSETCGSTTIIRAIRQAERDETVKAIVLRVDSPGGSALASDLIWNELKRCKKPVVASMSDVAASGGYYISMAAQKIYAEPGTLTGSIGVVGGKLALAGLYEKIGIKTQVLSRGANSGILSSDRPFTESERAAMTALMRDVYDQFLDKALQGRHKAGKSLSREELVKLAGGRVWTGRQARENGLVDELGGLEDAIACARKLANMATDREPELLLLPKSRSFLDALLDSGSESRFPGMDLGPLRLMRSVPGGAARLATVETLLQLRTEPVWMILPYQLELR